MMKKPVTVKTASEKDAPVIEALAGEIWTQHYVPIFGQPKTEYMLKTFQSQRAISGAMRSGSDYYIASCGGKPCGYCAVAPDRGIYLSKLYVLASYRGQGIGSAMMTAVYTFADKHKAHRIWLTCNKNNAHTLAVYKRLGFTIADSFVQNIGGGFVMDGYELEKKL